MTALMFFLSLAEAFADDNKIFYPRPESNFDERTGFPLTLLQLVFDRIDNGEKYSLHPTAIKIPRGRVLKLLEKNVVVNIQWTMTSTEREKRSLAIKFPIYQGYMGWRIFLIKPSAQVFFKTDMLIKDLKSLVAVQAPDWADTKILKANGFNVVGASSYAKLFNMIKLGRANYFPRSILEVWSEADYFASQGLVVEENLMFKYPSEMYFFVNKLNVELAKDIEKGLALVKSDGTYQLLFETVHQSMLERANLHSRTVINLENPLF
jgi:hypothetical protein